MKYCSYVTTLLEIPDEITLSLEITNCPHRCKNCHSPHLREDIGIIVDNNEIDKLLKENHYISCICFMGGDTNHKELYDLCDYIHSLGLKTAMYSGDDNIDLDLIKYLDYYKVGGYKEDLGPLDSPTTNQRLYRINGNELEDLTSWFRKR